MIRSRFLAFIFITLLRIVRKSQLLGWDFPRFEPRRTCLKRCRNINSALWVTERKNKSCLLSYLRCFCSSFKGGWTLQLHDFQDTKHLGQVANTSQYSPLTTMLSLSPCTSPPQPPNWGWDSSRCPRHTGEVEALFHSSLLVSKSHAVLRDRTYVSELSSPGIHVIQQLSIHCHPGPNLLKKHYYMVKSKEFLGTKIISDSNYTTWFKSRVPKFVYDCWLFHDFYSSFNTTLLLFIRRTKALQESKTIFKLSLLLR